MTSFDENYQKLQDAQIMIVDDEQITIDVVRAFLEEEKYYNFVAVSDAAQAMQTLEENRPDLLLLDLMMPEVSGFDILAAVRAHPKFKFLPIIIMTAASDRENKLKALGLGATDFLAKPLDQVELSLRVRNSLAAKAYQDQLAYYDGLTRLPNRQLFLEALSWALKAAKRHHEQLALLKIEIDNFEKVNDTIGPDAGDEAVRLIANRILKVVRQVDVLSRYNRDEADGTSLFHLERIVFSLLLDRIQGDENAAMVAERIIKRVRAPMEVGGVDICVTTSIGIVTYPTDTDESSRLLRRATKAMEYAKILGGDGFQFYSRAMDKWASGNSFADRADLARLLLKPVV